MLLNSVILPCHSSSIFEVFELLRVALVWSLGVILRSLKKCADTFTFPDHILFINLKRF